MNKGLGKGLGALIAMFDEDDAATTPSKSIDKPLSAKSAADVPHGTIQTGVQDVDINLVDNNINQPRKTFDPVQLQELADSIAINGIFQPVLVNKVGGRYMIVAGERRWRAAKLAGLVQLPVIVRDYSPRQVAEIAIVENLQREDLNEIDLARGIKKLMDDFFLTQEKVAAVLGKNRSSIANTLRLLNLPKEVQHMIEVGQLSAGHGKCLVAVVNPDTVIKLAKQCVTGRLSVRELEDMIRGDSERSSSAKPPTRQSPEIRRLAMDLSQTLGTKVFIQGNEKQGRIMIEYYKLEELERIVKKIIE